MQEAKWTAEKVDFWDTWDLPNPGIFEYSRFYREGRKRDEDLVPYLVQGFISHLTSDLSREEV
ncbi:MAG: hypothetical protein K940chlam7_01915 [Chlamydiae bacterium]|nr:hypothetical protein [Chlamydiota bacterium]